MGLKNKEAKKEYMKQWHLKNPTAGILRRHAS